VDASRQAFVDGMAPALYLGAGLALAAAVFTALRGPKTAAEAEPRLHESDRTAPGAGTPDLSMDQTERNGSNFQSTEPTGAEAAGERATAEESSGNMTDIIDTGGATR
jgi:hypothetical protein